VQTLWVVVVSYEGVHAVESAGLLFVPAGGAILYLRLGIEYVSQGVWYGASGRLAAI
jgi:hypothetical protein